MVHWNLGIFSTCIRNGFVGMKNGDCGLSADDTLDTAGGVWDPTGILGDPPPPPFTAPPAAAFRASLANGDTVLPSCKESVLEEAMSKGDGISLPLMGLWGVETVELARESSRTTSWSSLGALLRLSWWISSVILTVEPPSMDSVIPPFDCSSRVEEGEAAASSSRRELTEVDWNSEVSVGTTTEGIFDIAFGRKLTHNWCM